MNVLWVVLLMSGAFFWETAVAGPVSRAVLASPNPAPSIQASGAKQVYALVATDMDGGAAPLARFSGKVALIVNTASRCGLTPQYEGLQRLQARFEARGFTVLGFPSNDFLGQEPGSNREIRLFCEKNYQVSFPLFGKDHVKGAQKQAVYRYLTEATEEEFRGEIRWNFEKFLVGRDGRVLARFSPSTSPEDPSVLLKIEQALATR